MHQSNTKKLIAGIIMSGIFMPVFLLFAQPVNASPDPFLDIIFAADSALPNYDLEDVAYMFGGDSVVPLTYKARARQSDFLKMKQDSSVHYAEINSSVQAATIITNDPYFTTDESNENQQWYLEKIRLPDAWEFGRGSSDVQVAIIDTGIHASHLELNDGRILAGFNVITGKPIPANSDSDDNGHGTAVAGVIGAIPNNNKGIAGINWNIGIIPIKALEANGSGSISDVATGIIWAAENGAEIINLSLGGPGFGNDQTLNNAIIYAHNRGALIVSAAGNDLADNGVSLDSNPVYPICADGGKNMVIGVAATDVNDQKASFSNYGVNCVDISAPGKKILTTAFLPNDPSSNVLIYGSGTSLATPVVSGVAALLKANNLSLTNDQMKNIILRTADNIDALNQKSCLGGSCNGFLGRGRINALSALSPQPLLEGALVKEQSTGMIFYITGGKKKQVSDFVFQQRGFKQTDVISEMNNQLSNFPTIDPLPPLDGTLIKGQLEPTVFYMHQGLKRPLFHLVFQSRNFRFSDVKVLPESEVNQLATGEWYWPPDGVMVLIKGDPTVYVMDNGVKRPITYFVFTQRRLSFARVITLTQDEFSHLPKAPDQYWMPPQDGTLLKSDTSSVVYLILEGARRPLTYEAFVAHKLKFSDVKTLPQAEIDVILPGSVLTN